MGNAAGLHRKFVFDQRFRMPLAQVDSLHSFQYINVPAGGHQPLANRTMALHNAGVGLIRPQDKNVLRQQWHTVTNFPLFKCERSSIRKMGLSKPPSHPFRCYRTIPGLPIKRQLKILISAHPRRKLGHRARSERQNLPRRHGDTEETEKMLSIGTSDDREKKPHH